MVRTLKSLSSRTALTLSAILLVTSACGSGQESTTSGTEGDVTQSSTASAPTSTGPTAPADTGSKPSGPMPTKEDIKTLDPCTLITAEQWSAALAEGGFTSVPVEMDDDGGWVEGLDQRMCVLAALGSGLPLEMWSLRVFAYPRDDGTPRPDLPGGARQHSDTEVSYEFGELSLVFFNFPAIPATAKLYEAAVASYQNR